MSDEISGNNLDDVVDRGAFLFPSVIQAKESVATHKNLDELGPEKNLSGFASFKVDTAYIEEPEKEVCLYGSAQNINAPLSDDNVCASTFNAKKRTKSEIKEKEESSESDDHRKKRKKRKKKESKKPKKKKSKERQKAKVLFDKSKPDTIWLDKTSLNIKDAYREDRREERENLQFETLYRLDVANYQRKADIACLGLNRKQYFEWNDDRSQKRKAKKKEKDRRYFSKLKTEDEHDWNTFNVDIHGLPESMEKSEHLASEKSNEKDDESNVEYFSKMTEFYNEKLREAPNDVMKWIEFARLQDESFKNAEQGLISRTFDPILNPAGKHKAVTEKKISILEKALSINRDSLELILEYMEYCREILDPAEVHKKWNEFIFKNLNKGLLWQRYIMYMQSDLSSFSVSNIIARYGKCFKTMSDIAEGAIKTHTAAHNHHDNMLAIFAQYCLFLHQSDLPEKMIASLQAMVEFNCFVPEDIKKLPVSGQKAFFEAFWDSDAPRFGEQNASGWNSWMIAQQNITVTNDASSKYEVVNVNLGFANDSEAYKETVHSIIPKSKNWLNIERQRQAINWRPVKQVTTEGEDCDDPDRIVLADDIFPCLFKLPTEHHIKNLFLLNLAFLGVPVKKQLFNDFLVQRILETGLLPIRMKLFSFERAEDFICLKRTDEFSLAESNITLTPACICYIDEVFSQSLRFGIDNSSGLVNAISQCWLEFKIMLLKLKGALTNKSDIKGVRKFAKSLIKLQPNRNCLELWQSFAKFEYDNGQKDEALRIFDMLISMCLVEQKKDDFFNKPAAVFRSYVSFLINSYCIEAESRNELESKIINVLVLLSGDSQDQSKTIPTTKIHPLRLRRVKETYKEIFTELLFPGAVHETEAFNTHIKGHEFDESRLEWILCFALFISFVEGSQSADSVLKEVEENVRLTHLQALKIWKTRLDCYRFRTSKQCSRISHLRNEFWQAVSRFPEDSSFNEALLDLECTGLASLKMRRHHQKMLETSRSLISWMLASHYEEERLKRLETLGTFENVDFSVVSQDTVFTTFPNTGIVNRLRGLYNRATDSREGRFCVALWRRFLRFEAKYGDARRCKNVFYSALQNCPWSKDLYTDAIEIIGDSFEDIIDIMQEKEVRIRLPTEELDIMLEEENS